MKIELIAENNLHSVTVLRCIHYLFIPPERTGELELIPE